MNIWIILQTILNVFLVAAVVYCIFRFRKVDRFTKSREAYKGELIAFKTSLENTLEEGQRISNQILKNIEDKQKTLSDIDRMFNNEKNSLMNLIQELKSAGYSSSRINQKFQEPWINDNYAKAVKLSAEGFSPKEIADRIKLPLGEVELVLSLRK